MARQAILICWLECCLGWNVAALPQISLLTRLEHSRFPLGGEKTPPWRTHKLAHCPIQLIQGCFPSVVSTSRGAYLYWIHQCYFVPRRVQLCTFNQLVAIKLLMGFLELWVLYPLFIRRFRMLSCCSNSVQAAAPHLHIYIHIYVHTLMVSYSARRDKAQHTCKCQVWAQTDFLPFLMALCSSFCRSLAWFCLHLCL